MESRVVISLDFELRWGVADKLPLEASAYRRNIDGATDAVYGMLDLFQREGIGATWATVGALACSGWDEYHELAPRQPQYSDARLRFKKEWRELDPAGTLHFAPAVVRAIVDAPDQELGSHTFSHIYLREDGCLPTDVAADSRAIASLFEQRFGMIPTSFVFPRNQVAQTGTLEECGIRRWRANPRPFYWDTMRREEQSRWIRGLRLVNDVLPTGTRRAWSHEVRASYLLRFPLQPSAWKLHSARIRHDAANLQPGETLHLWWHPHNMGGDVRASLRRLSDLVRGLRDVVPAHTRFSSMRDAAGEKHPAPARECGGVLAVQ